MDGRMYYTNVLLSVTTTHTTRDVFFNSSELCNLLLCYSILQLCIYKKDSQMENIFNHFNFTHIIQVQT